MPSVQATFGKFFGSIIHIFTALLNSILAFGQSILALGQALISTTLGIVQSVIALAVDLSQDVIGFAIANFFLLALVGGGYYVYTQNQKGRTVTGKQKKRL